MRSCRTCKFYSMAFTAKPCCLCDDQNMWESNDEGNTELDGTEESVDKAAQAWHSGDRGAFDGRAVVSAEHSDGHDSESLCPDIYEEGQTSIDNVCSAHDRQVGGDHYKHMVVQPWDVVDTWPPDQQIGFHRGNALKYVMRAGDKGSFKEDIEKAHHFLSKLLEVSDVEHS